MERPFACLRSWMRLIVMSSSDFATTSSSSRSCADGSTVKPFPGDDALEARWISVDRLEDAGLELSRDVAKVARQAISSRESTGSPQISVMNTAVLDHVSITVPDLAVAEVFYDAALAALGIAKVGSDHADAWIGYGPRCDARHPDRTYFSIRLGPGT